MSGESKIEWRRSGLFPNYEVSNIGGVRRCTPGRGTYVGRVLKSPPDSMGYPTVNLEGKPRRVHVLVAAAFLDGWTPSCEVHHINEDKGEPRAENLEVAPSRLAHFERHRRRSSGRRQHGEDNPEIECACGCGQRFPKFDSGGRPRLYVTGHNYESDTNGRYAPRSAPKAGGRPGGEALLDGREWREFPVGAR